MNFHWNVTTHIEKLMTVGVDDCRFSTTFKNCQQRCKINLIPFFLLPTTERLLKIANKIVGWWRRPSTSVKLQSFNKNSNKLFRSLLLCLPMKSNQSRMKDDLFHWRSRISFHLAVISATIKFHRKYSGRQESITAKFKNQANCKVKKP